MPGGNGKEVSELRWRIGELTDGMGRRGRHSS